MAPRLSWASTASWKWFLCDEQKQDGGRKRSRVFFEASLGHAAGTVTPDFKGCGCAKWHHGSYLRQYFRSRVASRCFWAHQKHEPRHILNVWRTCCSSRAKFFKSWYQQGLCKTVKTPKITKITGRNMPWCLKGCFWVYIFFNHPFLACLGNKIIILIIISFHQQGFSNICQQIVASLDTSLTD